MHTERVLQVNTPILPSRAESQRTVPYHDWPDELAARRLAIPLETEVAPASCCVERYLRQGIDGWK